MEVLSSLLVGIGLAAACGFRVFVPLLCAGLAARGGYLALAPGFQWLASDPALIAFAAATVVEVAAYYVPWVDNLLDAIASPTAVLAGILAAAATMHDVSPLLRWALAIIAGGGAAGAAQAATVVLRGASSAATGGLLNSLVATVELLASALVSLLSIVVPVLCALFLVALLAVVVVRSRRARSRAALLVAGLLSLAVVDCAVNPATGKRELALIGEREEVHIGQEDDRAVVAEMGLYDASAAQDYVQRLGRGLAAKSERPGLPWSFRVIDDPVVNAFALPGGFIYVTRGIMAHLSTEAELSAVIGHEIGHVTARHGVNQMSKAQLAQLGLGLGSAVAPETMERLGGLTQRGLGLLFLKFSRDDERQADDLGLRYVLASGYDPRPMVDVFETLVRVGRASGSGRVPGWMSTHPAPEDRKQRISQAIAHGSASPGGTVGREPYEAAIENLVFGDDPRQGYFKDGVFYHPALAFRWEPPSGFKAHNGRQSVSAESEERDARVDLTISDQPTAAAASQAFFAEQGIAAVAPPQGAINGLAARGGGFELKTESGSVRGRVAFVEHGGKVFRLLGYGVADRWSAIERSIDASLQSFEKLTDRRFIDVEPKHLHVVRVQKSTTLEAFAKSSGATVDVPTLALLNRLDPGATLPAGSSFKVVTGGKLP